MPPFVYCARKSIVAPSTFGLRNERLPIFAIYRTARAEYDAETLAGARRMPRPIQIDPQAAANSNAPLLVRLGLTLPSERRHDVARLGLTAAQRGDRVSSAMSAT